MTLLIIGLVLIVLGMGAFAFGGFFSVAKNGTFNLPLVIGGWIANVVGSVTAVVGIVQIVIGLVEGFQ